MREDHAVEPAHALGTQVGQKHAAAGVEPALPGAGVEDEVVRGGLHVYRESLSDVEHREARLPRSRPRRLPEKDRSDSDETDRSGRRAARQQHPGNRSRGGGHQRPGRMRQDQRRARQRCAQAQYRLERGHARIERHHEQSGREGEHEQRERRDHPAHPRDGHQVGEGTERGDAAEPAEHHRREQQRQAPLHCDEFPPEGQQRTVPRQGFFGGVCFGRGVLRRRRTIDDERPHGEEGKPKPGRAHRPGIEDEHRPQAQHQHRPAGDETAAEERAGCRQQHHHGALRRHFHAREKRIGERREHAGGQPRRPCRQDQQPGGIAPPQCRRHAPGEHRHQRHVQAGDAHQVGRAGGCDRLPGFFVEPPHVADRQRREPFAMVRTRAFEPLPRRLAPALERHPRRPHGAGQGRRRCRHPSSGADAAGKPEEFAIEDARIGQTVRRAQLDLQPPARTGLPQGVGQGDVLARRRRKQP